MVISIVLHGSAVFLLIESCTAAAGLGKRKKTVVIEHYPSS